MKIAPMKCIFSPKKIVFKTTALLTAVFFIFSGIIVPSAFALLNELTLNEAQKPVSTLTLEQANAQTPAVQRVVPSGVALQNSDPLFLPENPPLNDEPQAAAQTFNVHKGESIQASIDQAQTGDTVYINAGTYYEHISLKAGVVLKGEDKKTTVIDGGYDSGSPVIRALGDNVIENLTITGAKDTQGQISGAIRIEGDHVTVRDNKILFNLSAGVYVQADVLYVSIEGNIFHGNSIAIKEPKNRNTISYNTIVGYETAPVPRISSIHYLSSQGFQLGIAYSEGIYSYRIQYSDDGGQTWKFAQTEVSPGVFGDQIVLANRAGITYWTDNGSTTSPGPMEVAMRWYRTVVAESFVSQIGIQILNDQSPVIHDNIIAHQTVQSIWEQTATPFSGNAELSDNILFHNNEIGDASGPHLPPQISPVTGIGWTGGNVLADPQFAGPSQGDYTVPETSPAFYRGAFVPGVLRFALDRADGVHMQTGATYTFEKILSGGQLTGWRFVYNEGSIETFDVDGTKHLDSTPPVIAILSPGTPTHQVAYQLVYTVDGVQQTELRTLVEGANALTVFASDIFGNWTSQNASVTLDTVAPSGSVLINNGDASTGSTAVNLTLTGSDLTSGVDTMRFSVDGGTTWTAWEAFATTKTVTLSGSFGTKEVRCQLRDKAANVATFSDTIVYGGAPPTIPVMTSTVPAFTNQTTLTLSGTKGAQTSILINGVIVVPLDNITTWTATVNLGTEGNNAFTVTSKNGAGDTSGPLALNVTRDMAAPTGSLTVNSGAAATSLPNVTLALTAGDATSGVDKVRFSADGGNNWTAWEVSLGSKSLALPAGDGTKQIWYQVSDRAGNAATFFSSILLDTTAPSGSVVINNGDAKTNSRSVTLTLTGSDAGAGLDQMRFSVDNGTTWSAWQAVASSASVTLADVDGTQTVKYELRDKVGISAVFSDAIILERTPLAGTVQINNSAAYTNSNVVLVRMNVTDGVSQVSEMRYSTNGTTWTVWQEYASFFGCELPSGDGTKTFYIQVRDLLGNVLSVSDTIILETVAPMGSIMINNGDTKTDSPNVTLQLTAADATSGVDTMRFSKDVGTNWTEWEAFASTKALTLTGGTGTREVQYQVRDKAGNIAAYADTISYDLGVPAGASVVSVVGGDRRLFVQNRKADGTLEPTVAFVAKGVNWSPTSADSNPDADPLIFRKEFQKWYETDIPLMAQMGINVVRVYHDFGTDANAIKVLDMLYHYGIKVIMTVDSPLSTSCADLSNISAVVNAYKNHPAILMWAVGNEWDINNYYGKFTSLQASAAFTQQAAQLIKSLDANHPVTTLVADSDNARIAAASLVPAIDVWGINIYREQSFGEAISQWKAASNKPFYIGEFGADSYDHRINAENQAMQAQMDGQLWDEAYFDLSAERTEGALIGALAFEWSDEWWKGGSPGSHTVSPESSVGQPDGHNDEKWFGIVDVNRNLKQAYAAIQGRFQNIPGAVQTNATPLITVISQQDTWNGSARIKLEDKTLSYRMGGITVAVIDGNTGIRLSDVRTFNTSGDIANMTAMIDYINSLPYGAVLAISIGGEGGFTNPNGVPWNNPAVEQAYQLFESLGSQKIRSVKLWYGWAMITVKGQGVALAEDFSVSAGQYSLTPVTVSARITPPLPLNPDAGRRSTVLTAASQTLSPAVAVAEQVAVPQPLVQQTVSVSEVAPQTVLVPTSSVPEPIARQSFKRRRFYFRSVPVSSKPKEVEKNNGFVMPPTQSLLPSDSKGSKVKVRKKITSAKVLPFHTENTKRDMTMDLKQKSLALTNVCGDAFSGTAFCMLGAERILGQD